MVRLKKWNFNLDQSKYLNFEGYHPISIIIKTKKECDTNIE